MEFRRVLFRSVAWSEAPEEQWIRLFPNDQSTFQRSHRMTPLRQRTIEDKRIRNFATTTERSYIHYGAGFAKHFDLSPDELDLEAVRQYQLHLLEERKLSPQSVNTFVSAVQFLYLVTLEMPWSKQDFPRTRVEEKLPVVPSPDEVRRLFEHVTGLKNRAVLMVCFGAGLRISEAVALKIAHINAGHQRRVKKRAKIHGCQIT